MLEPMISLKALFALNDGLRPFVDVADRLGAQKAVLDWAMEQGFLVGEGSALTMADLARRTIPEIRVGIPAGPQAEPEGQDAGGLNDKAPASVESQGPEGGEGVLPLAPADPPAPAVAGAGASQSDKLGTIWSEDEDRRAVEMRVAGHKLEDIAFSLGRTVDAVAFRLKTKLKERLVEAMQGTGAAKPAEPEKAGGVEKAGESAGLAREAPQAGAEGVTAASFAPSDQTRPMWWREATAALNALGYRRPFTAEVDLQIAEDVCRGFGLDVMAEDMRIAKVDIRNRWLAMCQAIGKEEGRPLTAQVQERLLQVLRDRAGVAAEAAE